MPAQRPNHLKNPPVDDGNPSISDVRPVPDPTTLTTRAVDRATYFIREIYDAQLDSLYKEITAIRSDIDRIRIFSEGRSKEIDAAISKVHEFYDEKFKGLTDRLGGMTSARDLQIEGLRSFVTETFTNFRALVEQADRLNKTALDAAFSASKEVVSTQQAFSEKAAQKAEAAFSVQVGEVVKRLDLISTGLSERVTKLEGSHVVREEYTGFTGSQNSRLQTMESRLTIIEARSAGAHDLKQVSTSTLAVLIAGVGALVLVVQFVFHAMGH